MLSKAYTALAAVGVLLFVIGLALITLDYLGKGDTSGVDYKDVGLTVLGLILAAIGGVMAVRKKPTTSPTPPSTT